MSPHTGGPMPRRALLLSLALVGVLLVPGAAGLHPLPVGRPAGGDRWLSLVAEARTTCGVKKDHTAWCWGRNTNGQLGDGTTASRSVPTRIKGSWSAISIGSTYPGGETARAVRTNGAGYCWGWSRWGQTGAHGQEGRAPSVEAPRSLALGHSCRGLHLWHQDRRLGHGAGAGTSSASSGTAAARTAPCPCDSPGCGSP